jgi:hypothetical protein
MTRKRNRRQPVGPEDSDLEHLRSGADRFAAGDAAAIRDADDARRGRLGDVVDAEQLGELDLRVYLLAALANRGARWGFVIVDETAWKAPLPITRLDGAPAENDSVVFLDDHRRGDLRVAPQHEPIVRANLELASFDGLRPQRRAAVDAEVTHRGRA